MRLPSNIPRLGSTMFTLYVIIPQILELVHSINPDQAHTVPAGHAGLNQGEGRTSGLERSHVTGFIGDKHILKARLLAACLITIFFSISAIVILMLWGCWRTADDEGLKQQEKLTAGYPEFPSLSTPVDDPTDWKVSIPHSKSDRSDLFTVPTRTFSKESLNHFPSSLAIGVYTGFTTGVGPRR
jgi:hypothetical protein